MCCPFQVPALRDRRGDIATLVEVLAQDITCASGMVPPEIGPARRAHWQPGPGAATSASYATLEQAAMASEGGVLTRPRWNTCCAVAVQTPWLLPR